jgi:uncharacterized protein YjbI with pentapeptide repeats
MAKKKEAAVLQRLAGKKVVFSGKFGYGDEERLTAMAKAQQGTVLDDLSDKVDYLVLDDLNAGKTIQKKAVSLNAKGAAIQVVEADAFREMIKPAEDELLALLKAGKQGAEALNCFMEGHSGQGVSPGAPRLVGARLDGLDLSGFSFDSLAFEKCSFVGAKLDRVQMVEALQCDFSKATGASPEFWVTDGSRFVGAEFEESEFHSDVPGCDFSGAKLDGGRFGCISWGRRTKRPSGQGPKFAKASLRGCEFDDVCVDGSNFDGADLTGASFEACHFSKASFRKARLDGVNLVGASMCDADFSGAFLVGANLAETDFSGSVFDGADLSGANVRGAKIKPDALAKAKNGPSAITTSAAAAGPAMTELDALFDGGARAQIRFQIKKPDEKEGSVWIGVYNHQKSHFAHVRFTDLTGTGGIFSRNWKSTPTCSDTLLQAGRVLGHLPVRFETVEVSSSKSPKRGKELQKLVMDAIAEAFGQEPPSEADLAAAAKAYRGAKLEAGAADREKRAQVKAAAEKKIEKAKKQIAKKVEKAVGKVTDIASFLKALEVRIERPKIDKATKMLKASGFKLFNDVTEEFVSGVVKSQTDPDLVYACRVDHAGHYACCTQNLNICGGLRGSICKHLLVLIVGLVQAGELDPNTIDGWIAKTHTTKPELDKEAMGEIFIKYKGAEAGEVDWRPTETVPEDYYAL